jgi:hypothetical protein
MAQMREAALSMVNVERTYAAVSQPLTAINQRLLRVATA